MREFSTPLTIEVPGTGNLTDDVVRNAAEAPDAVVFSRPAAGGGWDDVTAAEFLAEVSAVAKGLVAAGIETGDRVALISKTRYEWTLLDYAIWFAGAVTVPIYETSSAEQIEWILRDSGARAVVAEGDDHVARISEVRSGLEALNHVWSLSDNAVDVLSRLGADIADDDLEKRRTTATPLDLATLIYTSGTTGRPKGCMLTHGNFMFELGVAVDELHRLFESDGASTLLFLPLAHVFARIIQVGCVKSRARMGHSPDIKNLLPDLQSFQPTFILAVPRVFEKVFNTASQKATAEGRGKIFNRAADVAIAWSRGLDKGRPSLAVRAQHALFAKLVYGKLLTALGGSCQFAVSGGAPLGDRLGHFYRGIGLTVLEGYGLTETTAALTVNLPDAQKIGSVGRPLPGTAVRVADDGELLFQGGQVFAGYWENEEASREALEPDGWFHTGDVGEVDEEGFVKITGRKKEIIVTAGGKNVAPAVLEDRLRAHALVDQCVVVGDGQPFIAALVTLDREALPVWAEARGKSADIEELVDDADLRAEIEAAVEDANKAVSKAESIRKFSILTAEWTEEGGQLTPSLKLKRNVVMREFRSDVDALYS
ncbi:AMP-binding protein [Nocardioides sp. zg-579]|uniref:Acyl-CoA synthetase n=1 Tax=Nocardioides marmotae TaxID=2663857 RepID=A0A6I3JBU3_9ACTN|nr:AMP-dependent synthetase/ligase [Nocardioides marmotae]MCR6031911.1 AMP-binding protein [Gordonia jinghuaiqii]MTB95551.1 AMP-binding protein [Nocardioides marmotae]QKE00974.1 long-chain fatty acid--CoA ligase [Nocardioides marmotae]